MVCPYLSVCMYVILVDVGIVPNGSQTHACMVLNPIPDRMFAVV